MSRVSAIMKEIEDALERAGEDIEYVGFVHPDVLPELRHPSTPDLTMMGAINYLGGIEIRTNELVERGTVVIIPRDQIHDG